MYEIAASKALESHCNSHQTYTLSQAEDPPVPSPSLLPSPSAVPSPSISPGLPGATAEALTRKDTTQLEALVVGLPYQHLVTTL